MLFAIQLSALVVVMPGLFPLLFVSGFITLHVLVEELVRRLDEYSEREFRDGRLSTPLYALTPSLLTVPQYPDSRNVLEPNCTRCPHLAETRECISWGTGPLDSPVLVVGEAPGSGAPEADLWKGGNWTGMAYTARHSGRVIRDLMESVGYHDAYYTNAVKCFPPDVPASEASGSSSEPGSDGGKVSNREPTDEELATCRTHLVTEVEEVEPDAIVPTGKHATETLLTLDEKSLDGFTDHVLTPIDCEALSTPLLPVLHPSYQNIWIARLGYESEEYRERLREELDGLCAGG